MIWAVVMAGGVGTRFWPLSRRRFPKQLLPLLGKKTLIEETIQRLKPFIPQSRILIVTNDLQEPLIRKLLKKFPSRNILTEPCSRNTAPCLGLAALFIQRKDPEAVFLALPADHIIPDAGSFRKHLKVACQLASGDKHVVFGIPPRIPHTGFGYISCRAKTMQKNGVEIYRGWEFIEKPPLWQAKAFVRSGKFFWNSGMFAWKVSFFLHSISEAMPRLASGLARIRAALGTPKERPTIQKVFRTLPNISIDYGLMEKVENFLVVKGRFGWSDMGSWQELENWAKPDSFGNVFLGPVAALESRGNIVRSPKRLVALLGVRDLILVDTEDALLVSRKDRAQDVKKLVEELRRKKLDRYL